MEAREESSGVLAECALPGPSTAIRRCPRIPVGMDPLVQQASSVLSSHSPRSEAAHSQFEAAPSEGVLGECAFPASLTRYCRPSEVLIWVRCGVSDVNSDLQINLQLQDRPE